MRSMKQLVFILILTGLLGCTKEPALKVYSLDVPTVGTVHNSAYQSKSIKVIYPQSLKEQISQKMRFSYSSIDSGHYQNAQWSNTMSKLLQGTFIEVLEQSKLFKAVVSDTSTAKEDYRLESTIFTLNHSVRGTQSHAVMSIQFNLISVASGSIIQSKRFSYKEATPTTNAKGYVAATNRVVSKLSKDLVTWLQ